VLTGLALWAVSAWVMGSMMATSGAAWIAPAILANLTMHKFLYARGRRGGYPDD
jgi:Flp pilus assembly protein protease CpaA